MRLVLMLLFYTVLTPLAWLLRALRHDVLGRSFDPRAASYWRQRGAARRPGPP